MLCQVCTKLTDEQRTHLMPFEVRSWWALHQAEDRKRKMIEEGHAARAKVGRITRAKADLAKAQAVLDEEDAGG